MHGGVCLRHDYLGPVPIAGHRRRDRLASTPAAVVPRRQPPASYSAFLLSQIPRASWRSRRRLPAHRAISVLKRRGVLCGPLVLCSGTGTLPPHLTALAGTDRQTLRQTRDDSKTNLWHRSPRLNSPRGDQVVASRTSHAPR